MTSLMTTKLKPQSTAIENSAGVGDEDLAPVVSRAACGRRLRAPAPRLSGWPRWSRLQAQYPPSTSSETPSTKLASSEARKATAAATSSGRPIRPSGYPSVWAAA